LQSKKKKNISWLCTPQIHFKIYFEVEKLEQNFAFLNQRNDNAWRCCVTVLSHCLEICRHTLFDRCRQNLFITFNIWALIFAIPLSEMLNLHFFKCVTRCQFHQRSTSRFCASRSQKRKKIRTTWLNSQAFGIYERKSCM